MSDGNLTVGISASGRGYSCIARRGDHVVEDLGTDGLAQAVDRLFTRCDAKPTQLRQLRIDLGPGSYTGLRVAVTFARTVQSLASVEVLSATSLELIALRAWAQGSANHDRVVRPILDARRSRFHHAPVQLTDRARLLADPAAVEVKELLAAIQPREVLLVDSAVESAVEKVAAERECELHIIEPASRSNLGPFLLHEWLNPRPAASDDLEPLYLMGSYAGD